MAGRPVRIPKRWFYKMLRKSRAQYPAFGKSRRARIVGGIWADYSPETKIRIIKKYQ